MDDKEFHDLYKISRLDQDVIENARKDLDYIKNELAQRTFFTPEISDIISNDALNSYIKSIQDLSTLSSTGAINNYTQSIQNHNLAMDYYRQHYDDIVKYKLDSLNSIKELTDLAKKIPSIDNSDPNKVKIVAEFKSKAAETSDLIATASLLQQLDPSYSTNKTYIDSIEPLFNIGTNPHYFFVLSIDIRRSTEPMLRSNEASSFKAFITRLCDDLKSKITTNYGVFDKFTGDGVLGFFPLFYSGESAGYYAIKSAVECHEAFDKHYKKCRDCFSSVILDTGLGIGIDYGTCHMANINGLTLIGRPVVYACRLNAAEAGTTLLNQAAYTHIKEKYPDSYSFSETEIDAKYEGKILAYKLDSYKHPHTISKPDWISNNDKSNNDNDPLTA